MKLYEVLKEGLDTDLNSIKLIDIHRLPQRPIYDNQHKRITHPIIIKLQNALDKDRIMRNLCKLKMYNSNRQDKQEKETSDSSTSFLGAYASNQRSKANIFVTEHLPKAFYQQKKLLLSAFREARKPGKTTKWTVRNGYYSLFVDDVQVFA